MQRANTRLLYLAEAKYPKLHTTSDITCRTGNIWDTNLAAKILGILPYLF
jgi:hypothetical protein